MPKLDQDQWCSNCRQMVRPKQQPGVLTNYLVGLFVIGIYWFISLTQPWYDAVMAAGMAGIVATAFALKYDAIPHCPICKTDKLEQAAPVA